MSLADIIAPPQLYTFDGRDPLLRDEPPFADALMVTVDVTLSEEYEHGFEVTTNPVEIGIDVTDHKRARPVLLRMQGIVSDSPNNILDVFNGNLAGTIAEPLGDMTTRSQEAYAKLKKIAKSTEPLRIVTRLDVFENMTFTSFVVQKDDAGKYLGFTATLQEVRFATPEFGAFTPEVEHTATPTSTALKQPEPLETDVRSPLEQGVSALDGKAYSDKLTGQALEARARVLSNPQIIVQKPGELIQLRPGQVVQVAE